MKRRKQKKAASGDCVACKAYGLGSVPGKPVPVGYTLTMCLCDRCARMRASAPKAFAATVGSDAELTR